jgi:hypothetical protein
MSNPTKNNIILYVSLFLILLFGFLGFIIANQHNQYDEYIEKAQNDIINKTNP